IYNEAFEIAARMFPDDPVANLNAAFCALQQNNIPAAEAYLQKAGDSDEAKYARGVLLARVGKDDEAMKIFKSLPLMRQAREAENQLNVVIEKAKSPIKIVANKLP
ncbi:MAG: tetratricopeptide repeat protein, partial [Muribaculaceae bacterium]|nr:tetratricopeptide repeat protein [Muribaculaceae bacterium]